MDAVWAAIIGAAVGGVIGFGGTWLSGWQQAKTAAREHRRGAHHHMLVALQRERQIIERTWPLLGPVADPPPAFTDEEAAMAHAPPGAIRWPRGRVGGSPACPGGS
jgi:hypothetical protein